MITPSVDVNSTSRSSYPCDSQSVLKKIFTSYTGPDHISCWGVYYFTGDRTYKATIGKPGYGVKDITLTLKNYTGVQIDMNGKLSSTFFLKNIILF